MGMVCMVEWVAGMVRTVGDIVVVDMVEDMVVDMGKFFFVFICKQLSVLIGVISSVRIAQIWMEDWMSTMMMMMMHGGKLGREIIEVRDT